MKNHVASFVALMAVFAFSIAASAQQTAFYFSGDPGYIAEGRNETLSANDGFIISAQRNYDGGDSFDINNYTTAPASDYIDYSVDFAPASGVQLSPGFYPDATRFPFNFNGVQRSNGLSFYGDGRGDNQLTGEFVVLQADYSDLGDLLSFAADFIQNDENDVSNSDYGSIRYNSTVPLHTYNGVPASVVPEPSVVLLLLISAIATGLRFSLRPSRY